MKWTKCLFSLMGIALFSINLLVAQTNKALLPIILDGNKYYHKNQRIKKLKNLANIVYAAEDEQATSLMKSYMQSYKISTGIIGAGVAVGAVGLGLQLKELSKDPLEQNSDGAVVVLGGAVIMGIGALVLLPNIKNKLKPAINRYNNAIEQQPISIELMPTQSGLGLGINLQF